MEIEIYEQAKEIQQEIEHFNKIKHEIEKTRIRDNDEEFNSVRLKAFDTVCYAIARLKIDFKEL